MSVSWAKGGSLQDRPVRPLRHLSAPGPVALYRVGRGPVAGVRRGLEPASAALEAELELPLRKVGPHVLADNDRAIALYVETW
jgi:hypothetical protein